jgi:hypothetical protein
MHFRWILFVLFLAAALPVDGQQVVVTGSIVEHVDGWIRKGHAVRYWREDPPDSIKDPMLIFNHQYEFVRAPGWMIDIAYHYVNHCCTDTWFGMDVYLFIPREELKRKVRSLTISLPDSRHVSATNVYGRWYISSPVEQLQGHIQLSRKGLARWKAEVKIEGIYEEEDTFKVPRVTCKLRRFPASLSRELKPGEIIWGI